MRTSTFAIQLSAAVFGLAALSFAQTPAQNACENLKSLSIPGVDFTAVETVAAGLYQPPARAGRGAGGPRCASLADAPAHCRVAATLRPSSTPTSKWNSGCRWKIGMASLRW